MEENSKNLFVKLDLNNNKILTKQNFNTDSIVLNVNNKELGFPILNSYKNE